MPTYHLADSNWYWRTVSQHRDPVSLEKGQWPHALAKYCWHGNTPIIAQATIYYYASAAVAVDSSHMTASSSASCSRFDVVSLCYVPDDGTLGCRDTPRWAEGCAGPGRWLESHWTRPLVWCARLDRDPAHAAHGFGQKVASSVLWFGLDDWVTDQINREATRERWCLLPGMPLKKNNHKQMPVTEHSVGHLVASKSWWAGTTSQSRTSKVTSECSSLPTRSSSIFSTAFLDVSAAYKAHHSAQFHSFNAE